MSSLLLPSFELSIRCNLSHLRYHSLIETAGEVQAPNAADGKKPSRSARRKAAKRRLRRLGLLQPKAPAGKQAAAAPSAAKAAAKAADRSGQAAGPSRMGEYLARCPSMACTASTNICDGKATLI